MNHRLNSIEDDSSQFDLQDDQYASFLRALRDEDAFPEDDADDPDFLEDLQRIRDEVSDEDLLPMDTTGTPRRNWNLDPGPTQLGPNLDDEPLCPAWFTRSKYPLNSWDIEDIERELNLFPDYTTYDEMAEPESSGHCPDALTREGCPARLHLDQSLKPIARYLSFEKPCPEFSDVFPYELFGRSVKRAESSKEIVVGTSYGPVVMKTDAWTPEMIICLNRIINAHSQLLVQSFSLCVDTGYLKESADEMHAQLHSMFRIFHYQSQTEIGYNAMIHTRVPQLIHSRLCKTDGKKRQGVRKRRRDTKVEAVIDLTSDVQEGVASSNRSFKTSLDVPLLHLLPQIWQSLIVVSSERFGRQVDPDEIRVGEKVRKSGFLPSLQLSREIGEIMQKLESLMTCGLKSSTRRKGVLRQRGKWCATEEALFRYIIQQYPFDAIHFRKKFLPTKCEDEMRNKINRCAARFDKNWKRIESLLKETDESCVLAPDAKDKIENIQLQFVRVLDRFSRSMAGAARAPFGSRLDAPTGPNELQTMMNVMLGNISRHIAGSFNALMSMVNIVGGMQLMNNYDLDSSSFQRPQRDDDKIDLRDGWKKKRL